MSGAVIDGKLFAEGLRAKIADYAATFEQSAGRKAGLAVVLVGEEGPACGQGEWSWSDAGLELRAHGGAEDRQLGRDGLLELGAVGVGQHGQLLLGLV